MWKDFHFQHKYVVIQCWQSFTGTWGWHHRQRSLGTERTRGSNPRYQQPQHPRPNNDLLVYLARNKETSTCLGTPIRDTRLSGLNWSDRTNPKTKPPGFGKFLDVACIYAADKRLDLHLQVPEYHTQSLHHGQQWSLLESDDSHRVHRSWGLSAISKVAGSWRCALHVESICPGCRQMQASCWGGWAPIGLQRSGLWDLEKAVRCALSVSSSLKFTCELTLSLLCE